MWVFFNMETLFLNHVWWQHVHTNKGPTAISDWNCLIHSLILLNPFWLNILYDSSCRLSSFTLLHFLSGTCTSNPDISSCFRFLCLLCCCLILSYSSTNGSFLAFCFDVRWFTISFAWKAGFSLADSFAARSFASTPGFFIAFCFEARWCFFHLY